MEEKQEEKKKNGALKWIIIAIIVIIVIVGAGAGGFLAFQAIEANKSTGTEWGDIYYTKLEEQQKPETKVRTMQPSTKDCKVQFLTQGNEKPPIMTVKYETSEENKPTTNYSIFYIAEDNKVGATTYTATERDIETTFLYNKKEEKYKWYAKTEYDGYTSYTDIEKAVESNEMMNKFEDAEEAFKDEEYKKLNLEKTISFTEKEMPAEKIEETTAISKFEETFIEPENVPELSIVTIESMGDLKEIKKQLTEAVKEYKPMDELIIEEVKQSVTEETKKIEDRKEAIKKKEEEERKRKEEEARKKAAEEEAKGLKVGQFRLKYGTYVSDAYRMDSSMYGTIILKSNGTFHIKANCEGDYPYPKLDCDGTYKVGRVLNSFEYEDALNFTTNTGVKFSLSVVNNNSLSDQWHGYSYTGK